MQKSNELLADLLAVYYTVHRDTEAHPEPYLRADFLPPDDDVGEGDDGVDDADAVPVHPMFASGVLAGIAPMRGHGAPPPASALALFAAAHGDAE